MHNLVGSAFKIIATSIIAMAILDTSLVVVDTVSVHNKVVALSNVMQNEIARNNCVPDAITGLFQSQLEDIVEQSNIAVDINSNLTGTLQMKNSGNRLSSVDEGNVKEYGDVQTLGIQVVMKPTRIAGVGNKAKENDGSYLVKKRGYTYNLEYEYHVPCLRFLK